MLIGILIYLAIGLIGVGAVCEPDDGWVAAFVLVLWPVCLLFGIGAMVGRYV